MKTSEVFGFADDDFNYFSKPGIAWLKYFEIHKVILTWYFFFSLWSVLSPHHRKVYIIYSKLVNFISLKLHMYNGIEFFTATCLNWQHLLAADERKQIVLDSLKFLVTEKRIWLYGYVIMPNHVHILWRKQDAWLDKNVQQQFSKFTAQQFKFSLLDAGEDLSNYKSTQGDREYQFWERRPYQATMYNRRVLEEKLDYIHFNPVKAGLCLLPEDYYFSSGAFYLLNIDNNILTHYMDHI